MRHLVGRHYTLLSGYLIFVPPNVIHDDYTTNLYKIIIFENLLFSNFLKLRC